MVSGSGSGSGMDPSPFSITGLGEVSDSTIVVIRLSSEDLNEIKRRTSLATTRKSTVYISISEELTMDTFGNPNDPILEESG